MPSSPYTFRSMPTSRLTSCWFQRLRPRSVLDRRRGARRAPERLHRQAPQTAGPAPEAVVLSPTSTSPQGLPSRFCRVGRARDILVKRSGPEVPSLQVKKYSRAGGHALVMATAGRGSGDWRRCGKGVGRKSDSMGRQNRKSINAPMSWNDTAVLGSRTGQAASQWLDARSFSRRRKPQGKGREAVS